MIPHKDRGTFGKQDVGHIGELEEAERHSARLTVVERTGSPAEALEVLDMLGLLDGGA